jgi:hypothetical protein
MTALDKSSALRSPRDPLDRYEKGMATLLKIAGSRHPSYILLLTLQQRLGETISNTRQYGDDETQRALRNRIIAQLNMVSLEVAQTSFNSLCAFPTVGTFESEVGASSQTTLPLDAWPRFLEMDADYEQRRDSLLLSIIRGTYDEALAQYWHLLYYTGTRELWLDRDFVSNRLIEACEKEGDLRSLGLIKIKGLAWPYMYKNRFTTAKRILHDGMTTLVQARAQTDIGVFYEYMADIASEIGDVPSANGSYAAALSKVIGADSYRIELKQRFANVRHERLGCKRRVEGLLTLIEGFRTIKSYQEGIVQIELARSYHSLRSPEAIVIAEEAYELLHDNVMMPTSAAKAKQLIHEIRLGSHTRR